MKHEFDLKRMPKMRKRKASLALPSHRIPLWSLPILIDNDTALALEQPDCPSNHDEALWLAYGWLRRHTPGCILFPHITSNFDIQSPFRSRSPEFGPAAFCTLAYTHLGPEPIRYEDARIPTHLLMRGCHTWEDVRKLEQQEMAERKAVAKELQKLIDNPSD